MDAKLNSFAIDEKLFLASSHDPRNLLTINGIDGVQFVKKSFDSGNGSVTQYIMVLGRDMPRTGYVLNIQLDGKLIAVDVRADREFIGLLSKHFGGKGSSLRGFCNSEDTDEFTRVGEKLASIFLADACSPKITAVDDGTKSMVVFKPDGIMQASSVLDLLASLQ